MVELIKHASRQILAQGAPEAKVSADRKVAAATIASTGNAPAQETSELSSKAAIAAMANDPPVDIEAVGRIKEAIARGDYPIDLDQVAERLIDSFLHLKG
jgi:negative regulator of flagellin synthesis FlgM